MDPVFKALGDASRRRLLDMLHEQPGLTLGELQEGLGIRRQSVSQHLAQLERANLITTRWEGRRKLHFLNPVPIHEIQRRWIWKFEEPSLASLDTIKQRAEELAMSQSAAGRIPAYVYTTYIHATPEQVWTALTDSEQTSRFWGHAQVSEWVVGARVDHVRTDGSGVSDAAGHVIELGKPHRLAFEFDDPARFDDPTFEPSLVTFEIEAHQDIVKLTVIHSRLRTEDEREAIGQGWPSVFANLKTLLETGDVLPQAPWEFHAGERAGQMAKNE